MCLATFTKIGSKLRKIGRLQGDDFLMFAAMVLNFNLHNISLQKKKKSHADERDFDI